MLLKTLRVIDDIEPRSAAMNMAIDEALLIGGGGPVLRAYRWLTPAISFGYFERYAEVRQAFPERELVRRWTGGGTVDHTEDFTYSLCIPSNELPAPREVYAAVHRALAEALGEGAELATGPGPVTGSKGCFQNPVCHDVMMGSQKIAGAAQRRTRSGLLFQGSIQFSLTRQMLFTLFTNNLSEQITREDVAESVELAKPVLSQKYGTMAWMEQR